MTVVLLVLGALLLAAALVGCVLPVLPGPPLAFVALILASIATGWSAYTPTLLVVMGVLAAAVTAVDYLLPAVASRRSGASRFGVWGSVIGMLVGLILLPPFGAIIGAFAGAVGGELVAGKESAGALRAGWGVFVGTLLGVGAKLAYTGVSAFLFVRAF